MSCFVKYTWRIIFLFIFSEKVFAQVDADVTESTAVVYQNLKHLQNSNRFLFGQEFFNSYRYNSGSSHGDETYSDCFAVTGSHPMVLGSDFHYYLEKGSTEKSNHLQAVKWAYQQGIVVTFDWHLSGKGTSTYEYTETSKNLLNNIISNAASEERTWYLAELDKIINIINNELIVEGERIPIVFRPLHEMNGNWFWWGSRATSAANYKAMYALTVNYIKERTNSVLFCWSPNAPVDISYYPGNEYVDVIGLDLYEATISNLRQNLALIVDHAQANNKVAALTETGYRNDNENGDMATAYWGDVVLPAIANDPAGKAQKIAWVLTWINSSWSEPYVPHASSSLVAKQNFINFKNDNRAVFSGEMQSMYEPLLILSAESPMVDQLSVYPVPARNTISVLAKGFSTAAQISIMDTTGRTVYKGTVKNNETVIPTHDFPYSGLYIIQVTDSHKKAQQKIIIKPKEQ